ncbi:AAA-like domain-containing protein [Zhouia amylolytica]|uniref:AAA-like domain-containing protein n=1 Tax=Zhouia amylolytica TaxID=376730 RepID=A0A1I6T761_9FLAO|nr:type IV secretion system DNA-binding domain-containing protein [Zhouia amylolytica]SFS84940.1 AAA-like domain-containing protein [Zhouia amylolytica]
MNASEQATLNFYQWEYRHRGYYHFDTPVDIEVPYIPFRHKTYQHESIEDDGRAPSLFKQITKLLTPSKEKEESTEEVAEIEPRFLAFDSKPNLVGVSFSFPKGTEIPSNRNIEFLNMLSFTENLLSFEIIGTSESITIQFVCSEYDKGRVTSHLQAYFPTAIIRAIEIDDFGFDSENDIAIADFGLNDEYMRSIATTNSFIIDPLTSVVAIMESLQQNDIVVFQILFKGIASPLAKDITYSVSDGVGGSFFADAPEMPNCAKDKITNPLFSVVMRIATQGENNIRSQYLAQELARSISAISTSEYNKLIPLSNEGYDYNFHKYNLHHRLSNRLGFVLNSKELNTFLHYPNKTIVSKKLGLQGGKTKQVPTTITNQKYLLGINEHNGVESKVMLNDEMRLRHKHIIGATGVGKSTLITNMMIEDMNTGNGCALFDPHGDIVEDVLLRIPQHRKNDVIVIDPSDTNYSIGFNLLGATTDSEKIVLSSDLVSSFKRHATAWGDNMSAVLSNAINTFLESSRDGTLIELKRFLLEDSFRKEFLTSVQDPSIHYYWNNEYAMVSKRIAPLLTRIDTFLRPKVIRYMLAQTGGVDFKKCIEEKKIVLIKLSQGLIGEENSFLLGSIFLSKFNQVAQGRQSLPKHQRHPYYIYLDEFQNFITPSITRILSGARKYGLGLVLAHQELGQIDDAKILNSVISNPYTRICFRLGDSDAKRLESGFSYFEQSDLQSLGIGQAIMRVGSSNDDFNISTFPLPKAEIDAEINRKIILTNTRNSYAKPKVELDKLLISLLPKRTQFKKEPKEKVILKKQEEVIEIIDSKEEVEVIEDTEETIENNHISDTQREQLVKEENESLEVRAHTYLQSIIKKLGQDRNYKATKEYPTKDGGRIDMVLEKNGLKIAFEISETNKPAYEVKNIKKCLKAGCIPVVMVSKSKHHLMSVKKLADKELSDKDKELIQYLQPDEIPNFLDQFILEPSRKEEVVKGYRIVTEFDDVESTKIKNLKSRIARVFKRKK